MKTGTKAFLRRVGAGLEKEVRGSSNGKSGLVYPARYGWEDRRLVNRGNRFRFCNRGAIIGALGSYLFRAFYWREWMGIELDRNCSGDKGKAKYLSAWRLLSRIPFPISGYLVCRLRTNLLDLRTFFLIQCLDLCPFWRPASTGEFSESPSHPICPFLHLLS